jgi:hypothetical protein
MGRVGRRAGRAAPGRDGPSAAWGLRRARAGAALAFGLVGAVYFTWAARLPAVKADLGLSDGQLAVALIGLEAGALVGLQVGGVLVPRVGSRAALGVSLPLLAALLAGPGLAASLPVLTAAAFVLAAAVNVATVAMNAYGVAVEQRYGRPILSSLYAMHSLGGIGGAGVAALAAALGVGRAGHFLAVALGAALAGIATGRLLEPSAAGPAAGSRLVRRRGAGVALGGWLGRWSGRLLVLGGLAFCVELAQSSGSMWGAVYLRDGLDASAGTAAVGIAVFMAGTTAGRLVGDRLRSRLGPTRLFRAGGLVAGVGFGGALLVPAPAAGIAGLALLGAGTSVLLPLAVGAAGNLDPEPAPAVARVATLGCLGSFTGPALIGALAGMLGLAAALGLPALLVAGTALCARAVQPTTWRGTGQAAVIRSRSADLPSLPG